MITEFPETFDDTIISLYRLSEWVLSLLQDGRYGRVQVAALAKSYAKISDALDLLNSYEQATISGNEDLASEYERSYSDLITEIHELILELKEDGIVIRLQ